ncbi:trafficking protein particle complex subunit 2 [Grosmannia clavigera kw1407]|uniref:Trafficking protein particle complex subunit 2 n=1 Tax=Grosmannia clavigera (strain kw1407 / UAMH 11150) TaxID=655863 RepID=F0XGY3_GROCL|nr:trafficking protein particle complex subunit 2 [Grosmannia clavigera kw1407]EFX03247.1 trafficking protein particle complex subunit 2 [Grosmannia clavigera kw1407]
MSYYFAIVGTQDNPLFEYDFGTSKQGGDGLAHFSEQARHLNQFIVHSSLDVVEEVLWGTGQMYLKCVDKFFQNYVSCFVTGANTKFLLLHTPSSAANAYTPGINGGLTGGNSSSAASVSSRASTSIGANPTSAATEEAIKNFFFEVYESWVKATMNPFYKNNMEISSPVFRARVAAAGKKYL